MRRIARYVCTGVVSRSSRPLSTSSGVVPCTDRAAIHVRGADAKKLLQGITTNDMNKLTPQTPSMFTSFLNPKGRVVCEALLHDLSTANEERVIIEAATKLLPILQRHLQLYKLRAAVEISDILEDVHPVQVLGTDVQIAADDIISMCTDVRTPHLGTHALLKTKPASPSPSRSSVSRNYRTWRTFLGIAEGAEIYNTIPLESNIELLNGVSFEKGCYVGQELVARTHFKGFIRKRIVPLILSTNQVSVEDGRFSFANLFSHVNDLITLSNDSEQAIPGQDSLETKAKGSAVYTRNDVNIGDIITVVPGTNIGIGILRLEPLKGSTGTELYLEKHRSVQVLPYRPPWWPVLDDATGKMLE